MNSHGFDNLARLLGTATSRRGIARFGSGALATLGFSSFEMLAAKSGKCKQKCGFCAKCDKGKCTRKNGKKRCKKGKCKAAKNGALCATNGGVCQNGDCVCPDGRPTCKDGFCCLHFHVCENGQCGCPDGLEQCGESCVAPCPAGISTRNPITCGCCRINGGPFPLPCNNPFPCCSEQCVPLPMNQSTCIGLDIGESCDFSAQCANNRCLCTNGDCGDTTCQD